MKIENKRQWVGELFFLLGTILYITYYFFYIAYYWYVEKDPTRQIPMQSVMRSTVSAMDTRTACSAAAAKAASARWAWAALPA